MTEFSPVYHQQPNATVPIGIFLLGLIIGGGLIFGFQQFQTRTQKADDAPAVSVQATAQNREQQAKERHEKEPGYWLQESDYLTIETNVLPFLDYPKGMSERDYSSRPQTVAPKEYYTPTMTVLFLRSDGKPMWLSLESQKKWLELQLQYSSEALINDKDQDGIVAFEENVIYGTSDTKVDTDGDGFVDKEELQAGFDPLHAGKKLNEWIENSKTLTDAERQELELLGPYLRGEEDTTTAQKKLQDAQLQNNAITKTGNVLPVLGADPK